MRAAWLGAALLWAAGCAPEVPGRSCAADEECFSEERCVGGTCVTAERLTPQLDGEVESPEADAAAGDDMEAGDAGVGPDLGPGTDATIAPVDPDDMGAEPDMAPEADMGPEADMAPEADTGAEPDSGDEADSGDEIDAEALDMGPLPALDAGEVDAEGPEMREDAAADV